MKKIFTLLLTLCVCVTINVGKGCDKSSDGFEIKASYLSEDHLPDY